MLPLSALVKTMSGLFFTKILASLISLEGCKNFDLCLLPFFLKLLTTFVIYSRNSSRDSGLILLILDSISAMILYVGISRFWKVTPTFFPKLAALATFSGIWTPVKFLNHFWFSLLLETVFCLHLREFIKLSNFFLHLNLFSSNGAKFYLN